MSSYKNISKRQELQEVLISIIISTRNRPISLKECLNSILKSAYLNYEVLISDQSDDRSTVKELLGKFRSKKIRYFYTEVRGKSYGLNYCIKRARGKIYAFTDDDCLIDKKWLSNINQFFKKNNDDGVLGSTSAFKKSLHPGLHCPSTTLEAKPRNVDLNSAYDRNIPGQGNNMAFRKSTFEKFGGFIEWLGPGAKSGIAEDIELIYRILKKGGRIFYDPRIKIVHNRWLNGMEYLLLCREYSKGLASSVAYNSFIQQDILILKPLYLCFEKEVFKRIRYILKLMLQLRFAKLYQIRHDFASIYFQTLAIFQGLFYGIYRAVLLR